MWICNNNKKATDFKKHARPIRNGRIYKLVDSQPETVFIKTERVLARGRAKSSGKLRARAATP